ncbi:hypothetical protein B0H16DRAFT_1553847 [Mycena metata]|uniref:Uncharacterized protein n=1 Tax=Mycena metata TaxID=1033252 RepID=A0AAD7IRH5_9AGAR|nr:hypothetical protein B0H16DRAFT_1553847 [Mycena metata]
MSGSDADLSPIWELEPSVPNKNADLSQMIISPDGWVTNPRLHHLVWVPAWLHFCGPPTSLVITPNGATKLDLTNFVHGLDWVKCMLVEY